MISYLPSVVSAESEPADSLYLAEPSISHEPANASTRLTADRSRLEEIERLGRSCREGESTAWDPLFSAAWPVLVTFVHRLYRSFDEQDAEDVAQASLEAAIQGIRTFTDKGSFRGWLFGIATRQAAAFHRQRSARKRGAGLLVCLKGSIEASDDGQSPAEISAARDRAGILHRALDELDETDRDLVHLHFFGELTFKEIAAIRKMNPKTVCTRLTRARERLLVILARFNLRNADG